MKVLVTGSTGFVGLHLCEALINQGEVFALARSPKKASSLPENATVVSGDLSFSSIEKWVQELPQDLTHVVHTAGIVQSFDPGVFNQVNFESTKFLVEKLKERYQSLHFVFVSSLAASGPSPTKNALSEKDPLSPVSAYGRSKRDAESALLDLAPSEWKTTVLRPPMVIGPRDTAILDVFKMISSGFILSTGLDGMKKNYSFICVFDLIGIIESCLIKQTTKHETFFTSHPNSTTFRVIVELIAKQFEKSFITIYIPVIFIKLIAFGSFMINKIVSLNSPLTPDKVNELTPKNWLCRGGKATELLGFDYEWDLEKTIAITYEDYKSRNWI